MDNLRRADEKARRGKLHTYGVQVHDRNREANLLALHEALLTKTFKTSRYEVFTVFEPKERLIYRLPYYPDRIVHHAVMNILEPIWVSVFPYNTYSCIKGRGVDFVGFVFYHNQTCIRKSIKQNFCRAVARQNRRTPPMSPKAYKQGVCSWLGWAKYSNSRNLLKSTIKPQYYESIL